jgi:hypothetical protein
MAKMPSPPRMTEACKWNVYIKDADANGGDINIL